MNHLRGETCKKGRETGEEGACVPRFWQFGEQQFGFRVVFIGPQVFKTKDANDSEGLGYGLRPVVNVLESLSLRIGYAKRMLVAVSGIILPVIFNDDNNVDDPETNILVKLVLLNII